MNGSVLPTAEDQRVTANAHEIGATVGAWNAVVRRARMTDRQKLAALLLSSYANAKGRDIHCGAARLAVDMDASYRTARRYLAWLRNVGLIELVRAGNRRRGRSDEYRLILGPNVLEDLEVPDPERYNAMCKAVADANQGTSKVSRESADVEARSADDQGTSYVSHGNRDQGTKSRRSGDTLGDPPPPIHTSPRRSTSPADDGELRTDVAVGRARDPDEPAPVVELFPGASQEARYRPPPRWASRGADAIAEAMARRAAARDAHRTAKEAT